jgi:hypothetical protein
MEQKRIDELKTLVVELEELAKHGYFKPSQFVFHIHVDVGSAQEQKYDRECGLAQINITSTHASE